MRASVGDRIVIASSLLDHPSRDGVIVEVRSSDGSPPYLVEWSDNGHRGLLFPGPDAHLQHFEPDGSPTAVEPTVRKRSWRVDIEIAERDGRTTAHATLVGDGAPLDSVGQAHANPLDLDVPDLGPEVAAARALRGLADRLLASASAAIGEIENAAVALQPR